MGSSHCAGARKLVFGGAGCTENWYENNMMFEPHAKLVVLLTSQVLGVSLLACALNFERY